MESIGHSNADATTVAFLAGYTVNGHFNNLRGKLKSNGYIDYPSGGRIALTQKGRVAAPDVERPRTLAALHQAVRDRLDHSMVRLLDPVIAAYPKVLDTAEHARLAGYTVNGHYNNMRGRLRTMGLIQYPSSGSVMATDVLFPSGLKN
jgi:hypothetical protein